MKMDLYNTHFDGLDLLFLDVSTLYPLRHVIHNDRTAPSVDKDTMTMW